MKAESVYCTNCGSKMGYNLEAKPILGLICTEPSCSVQTPPGFYDSRNALITALFRDKVAASEIARMFGISRQRVYQIAEAYSIGL